MNTSEKLVAIIGGGASGFFAAINCKINHPDHQVVIFEKSNKTLSKVKVSGGGRCNVTHDSENRSHLANHYPRGKNQIKKAFGVFDNKSIEAWFKERGVDLKVEADGRMFPTTDRSSSIINCFLDEVEKLHIKVNLNHALQRIDKKSDGAYSLNFGDKEVAAKYVIIATGGAPKLEQLSYLNKLDIKLTNPVPSLFTFNIPSENTADLMGQSVKNIKAKIVGGKLTSDGPILFTHWGFSGPAILKLSSFGARELADKNYQFNVQINWLNHSNEDEIKSLIKSAIQSNHKKQFGNLRIFDTLSSKVWEYLLVRSGLDLKVTADQINKKQLNKLVQVLSNDQYKVEGKTTFKEEFVTCGGVDLSEVSFKTMQAHRHENLYFTGEVLDIDAVTGGFNFQAAWSTAFIAAKLQQ